MIERTQKEHGVVRGIWLLEMPRVPDVCREQAWRTRRTARLVDLSRNRIDQMDRMTLRREPGGVVADCAPDIEDAQGSRRQVFGDDLLGAHQLETALRAREPVLLGEVIPIVGDDLL